MEVRFRVLFCGAQIGDVRFEFVDLGVLLHFFPFQIRDLGLFVPGIG